MGRGWEGTESDAANSKQETCIVLSALPAALQWNNNQLVQCSSAGDKPNLSQKDRVSETEIERRLQLQAVNASELILDRNGHGCFGITQFIFRLSWCEIWNTVFILCKVVVCVRNKLRSLRQLGCFVCQFVSVVVFSGCFVRWVSDFYFAGTSTVVSTVDFQLINQLIF